MYVTTDSFALVAIDQRFESEDKTIPDNNFRFLKWNEYVDFHQLDNGYWYINSIDDLRISIDPKGDVTETKRLIRLTDVHDSTVINKKNKITRETDLYELLIPYNSKFWDNYNAPPKTAEREIVKDLY
jgi:hypothetical protein